MANFDQATTRTPVRVGDIEVRLFDPDPLGDHADEGRIGRVLAQVVFSDGSRGEIRGNLQNLLTAQQLTNIGNLLDFLRNKGNTEIIPT